MQEFFFTVLTIWVIWKVFGMFSGSRSSGPTYQQTTHHHYYQQKEKEQDGKVRVEAKKPNKSRIPNDEGEYVDYEEVK